MNGAPLIDAKAWVSMQARAALAVEFRGAVSTA